VVGSWEADFFPSFAPREGEHLIAKNRYDAFIGTRLERLLIRLGIRTLVVGGVVTTSCLESTIRDAAYSQAGDVTAARRRAGRRAPRRGSGGPNRI
jgi:nicotinamidase-related amidase